MLQSDKEEVVEVKELVRQVLIQRLLHSWRSEKREQDRKKLEQTDFFNKLESMVTNTIDENDLDAWINRTEHICRLNVVTPEEQAVISKTANARNLNAAKQSLISQVLSVRPNMGKSSYDEISRIICYFWALIDLKINHFILDIPRANMSTVFQYIEWCVEYVVKNFNSQIKVVRMMPMTTAQGQNLAYTAVLQDTPTTSGASTNSRHVNVTLQGSPPKARPTSIPHPRLQPRFATRGSFYGKSRRTLTSNSAQLRQLVKSRDTRFRITRQEKTNEELVSLLNPSHTGVTLLSSESSERQTGKIIHNTIQPNPTHPEPSQPRTSGHTTTQSSIAQPRMSASTTSQPVRASSEQVHQVPPLSIVVNDTALIFLQYLRSRFFLAHGTYQCVEGYEGTSLKPIPTQIADLCDSLIEYSVYLTRQRDHNTILEQFKNDWKQRADHLPNSFKAMVERYFTGDRMMHWDRLMMIFGALYHMSIYAITINNTPLIKLFLQQSEMCLVESGLEQWIFNQGGWEVITNQTLQLPNRSPASFNLTADTSFEFPSNPSAVDHRTTAAQRVTKPERIKIASPKSPTLTLIGKKKTSTSQPFNLPVNTGATTSGIEKSQTTTIEVAKTSQTVVASTTQSTMPKEKISPVSTSLPIGENKKSMLSEHSNLRNLKSSPSKTAHEDDADVTKTSESSSPDRSVVVSPPLAAELFSPVAGMFTTPPRNQDGLETLGSKLISPTSPEHARTEEEVPATSEKPASSPEAVKDELIKFANELEQLLSPTSSTLLNVGTDEILPGEISENILLDNEQIEPEELLEAIEIQNTLPHQTQMRFSFEETEQDFGDSKTVQTNDSCVADATFLFYYDTLQEINRRVGHLIPEATLQNESNFAGTDLGRVILSLGHQIARYLQEIPAAKEFINTATLGVLPSVPSSPARRRYFQNLKLWHPESPPTWNRLILMMVITSQVCLTIISQEIILGFTTLRIIELFSWCVDFVEENFSIFIAEQGGWNRLIDMAKEIGDTSGLDELAGLSCMAGIPGSPQSQGRQTNPLIESAIIKPQPKEIDVSQSSTTSAGEGPSTSNATHSAGSCTEEKGMSGTSSQIKSTTGKRKSSQGKDPQKRTSNIKNSALYRVLRSLFQPGSENINSEEHREQEARLTNSIVHEYLRCSLIEFINKEGANGDVENQINSVIPKGDEQYSPFYHSALLYGNIIKAHYTKNPFNAKEEILLNIAYNALDSTSPENFSLIESTLNDLFGFWTLCDGFQSLDRVMLMLMVTESVMCELWRHNRVPHEEGRNQILLEIYGKLANWCSNFIQTYFSDFIIGNGGWMAILENLRVAPASDLPDTEQHINLSQLYVDPSDMPTEIPNNEELAEFMSQLESVDVEAPSGKEDSFPQGGEDLKIMETVPLPGSYVEVAEVEITEEPNAKDVADETVQSEQKDATSKKDKSKCKGKTKSSEPGKVINIFREPPVETRVEGSSVRQSVRIKKRHEAVSSWHENFSITDLAIMAAEHRDIISSSKATKSKAGRDRPSKRKNKRNSSHSSTTEEPLEELKRKKSKTESKASMSPKECWPSTSTEDFDISTENRREHTLTQPPSEGQLDQPKPSQKGKSKQRANKSSKSDISFATSRSSSRLSRTSSSSSIEPVASQGERSSSQSGSARTSGRRGSHQQNQRLDIGVFIRRYVRNALLDAIEAEGSSNRLAQLVQNQFQVPDEIRPAERWLDRYMRGVRTYYTHLENTTDAESRWLGDTYVEIRPARGRRMAMSFFDYQMHRRVMADEIQHPDRIAATIHFGREVAMQVWEIGRAMEGEAPAIRRIGEVIQWITQFIEQRFGAEIARLGGWERMMETEETLSLLTELPHMKTE